MLSVALVCLFFCLPSVQAQPLHVHVVLSEESGAYREFSDALRDELKMSPVTLSVGNADVDAQDADLIVAVGMRSATALATTNKPVLNVLVPRVGYDRLATSAATRHASVIYLDQPIERQISLLLAALPKARHIGMLYSEPPSGLATLRRLAAERNLKLRESIVTPDHPLSDALGDVLEVSDVLLVLPDTDVYNSGTIRNILLASYRKQIPLIGLSKAYVNAGALCAIYSTPPQIAAQAAEAIKQFAGSGKLPPGQYPNEFEVSVNIQVARSLDLPIKDAEELRNEVRRVP